MISDLNTPQVTNIGKNIRTSLASEHHIEFADFLWSHLPQNIFRIFQHVVGGGTRIKHIIHIAYKPITMLYSNSGNSLR